MRTTINLDEEAIEAARSLAHQESISLGDAVSRLIHRALRAGPSLPIDPSPNKIPTFEVAENAPRFGSNDVRRALEEE